jgi:DNA-binding CsgD family transcriptional regulator
MPWGTHFCLFYQARHDLLDTLVSYYRSGLRNDELGLWIASPELPVDEVWSVLREAIPQIDHEAARGRIEVISHDDWFFPQGHFEIPGIMAVLAARCERAIAEGRSGIRFNGSPAWLQKRNGAEFNALERAIDETIAGRRIIVLCNFPLDASKAGEMLAAAHTHHFTIAIRDGVSEIVEAFEDPPREHSLTRRELEVLTWVARGKSAWEISQILGIAKRTVDEHVQAATQKLGAVNRTQAVALALLRHLIEI